MTSRRPLHVPGEQVFPVHPLPAARPAGAAGETAGGAVELFILREDGAPCFRLTADNAGDVVAICDRLDGLPLAIELAAARTKLLNPGRCSRDSISLEFERGSAGRPDRQRTLHDAIAWSYDLLSPAIGAFFRRMGAFAGSCDLAAVAAVAAGGTDPLDSVAELAEAGLLIVRDGPDSEPRVGMLQTVRAFAQARLAKAGELSDAASAGHASFYAGLAETLVPHLRGPQPLTARDRIEDNLENVRAALSWCLEPGADGQPLAGTDLPGPAARPGHELVLVRLRLYRRGSPLAAAGGRRRVRRGRPGPGHGPAWAGHPAAAAGRDRRGDGRADGQPPDLEAGGNRSKVAIELCSLGVAHWTLGDLDTGRAMLRREHQDRWEVGDETMQSNALSNLGAFEVGAGRVELAIELLEQALAIDERLGNTWGCAVIQANLDNGDAPGPGVPTTRTPRCGARPPILPGWVTSS